MRTLLLMRGAPGCGKSTWIKNKGLENYKLCADDIRLLYRSPCYSPEGKLGIDQRVNTDTFKTLFEILEKRMAHGELTVIDVCNSKTSEMSRFKSLADKYRYRTYCVDFTSLPIEIVKERNIERAEHKRVPEQVIENMHSRFQTQKVPSGITIISPFNDDFETKVLWKKADLNTYKKVIVCGDIHGCDTALQELLQKINNSIEEDKTILINPEFYYIFVGDYLDRGIENAEVFKFLHEIKDLSNVCLLEGNHEIHLWKWHNNENIRSKEFYFKTLPQLEQAGITKKQAGELYRKLNQCMWFTYNNADFFVNHGGISGFKNNNPLYTATYEFIHGTGKYEDKNKVEEAWFNYNFNLTKENETSVVQIFGHRNINKDGINEYFLNFNLEGEVEKNGYLRAVSISKFWDFYEIKNNVYDKRFEEKEEQEKDLNNCESELLQELRKNPKDIIEKKVAPHISSFNFSRNVFQSRNWNNINVKARGLFVNTKTGKIVIRGYDKMFAVEENVSHSLSKLQSKIQFPLQIYTKYNGFLGLLSYDEETDDLIFASKSSLSSEHSQWFKEIFMAYYKHQYDNIKKFLKENNVNMLFEVIDVVNDRHIIEYDVSKIVLLDIIYKEVNFHKFSYGELKEFANKFNFDTKGRIGEINKWEYFYQWYQEINSNNILKTEGFVVEDSSGFAFKVKTPYYNKWKNLRGISQTYLSKGQVSRLGSLQTVEENEFFGFVKQLKENNYDGEVDIITLRDMFYKQKEEAIYE